MLLILLLVVILVVMFKDNIPAIVKSVIPAGETQNFLNGLPLRNDNGGLGHYGAPRSGGRVHNGFDISVKPQEEVKAPFNCILSRVGYVYSSDLRWRLLECIGTDKFKGWKVKIMYADTLSHNINKAFKQGEKIGFAQDISKKYASVTPHLHYEVFNPQGERINPANYV